MSPAEFAARRRLIGLTAAELAAELHINPRTIRSYESGRDPIPEWAEVALDRLLGEHTATVEALDDAGVIIDFSGGDRSRGWYLAIGARLVDRDREVMLTWGHAES